MNVPGYWFFVFFNVVGVAKYGGVFLPLTGFNKLLSLVSLTPVRRPKSAITRKISEIFKY
jgi:hypothetical protein